MHLYLGYAARITPAHAGTTSGAAGSIAYLRDHPRSRGDNITTESDPSENPGSPPLTRGQHDYIFDGEYLLRITPAHAGTTVKDPNNYAIFYLLDPVFIHFSKL